MNDSLINSSRRGFRPPGAAAGTAAGRPAAVSAKLWKAERSCPRRGAPSTRERRWGGCGRRRGGQRLRGWHLQGRCGRVSRRGPRTARRRHGLGHDRRPCPGYFPKGFPGAYHDLAVDAAGNLYFSAAVIDSSRAEHWAVFEKRAGQSTFTTATDTEPGAPQGIAVDSAGDVYTVGEVSEPTTVKGQTYNVEHWIVRRMAPGGSFATVDDFNDNLLQTQAHGIAIIGGGGAGIYVVGESFGGGARRFPPGTTGWSAGAPTVARPGPPSIGWLGAAGVGENSPAVAVTVDPFGNLYVVGSVIEATLTGYTKNKLPIYSNDRHWVTHRAHGQLGLLGHGGRFPVDRLHAVHDCQRDRRDSSGHLYVSGYAQTSPGNIAIIRSNVGGQWATVDAYSGTFYYGIASDPAGNLYAYGPQIIRSLPTAPTNLTAIPDPVSPHHRSICRGPTPPAPTPLASRSSDRQTGSTTRSWRPWTRARQATTTAVSPPVTTYSFNYERAARAIARSAGLPCRPGSFPACCRGLASTPLSSFSRGVSVMVRAGVSTTPPAAMLPLVKLAIVSAVFGIGTRVTGQAFSS